jgi:hypothetical protein
MTSQPVRNVGDSIERRKVISFTGILKTFREDDQPRYMLLWLISQFSEVSRIKGTIKDSVSCHCSVLAPSGVLWFVLGHYPMILTKEPGALLAVQHSFRILPTKVKEPVITSQPDQHYIAFTFTAVEVTPRTRRETPIGGKFTVEL